MSFKVININGNHEQVVAELQNKVRTKNPIIFLDEPWMRKFNLGLYTRIIFSRRSIIYLHNLNRWYLNDTKWKQLYFRFILFWINYIVVPSDTMRYELIKLTKKQVLVWPFYTEIPMQGKIGMTKEITRIVVPGSVSGKRRNYEDIIGLAKFLIVSDHAVELVVLGSLQNNSESDEIRELSVMSHKVRVYEEFVSGEEFNEVILSSDILIANAVECSFNDGGKEYYGRTKETGSVFLAINSGAHLLVPTYLSVPFGLEKHVYRWDGADDLIQKVEFILKCNNKKPDYTEVVSSIMYHRNETINVLNQW